MRRAASLQFGLVVLKVVHILAAMLLRFLAQKPELALPKLYIAGVNMFAQLGTVLVIAQMALLSFNMPSIIILSVGLAAAICWSVYAINNNDRWLLITNATVGGFAIWGLS